MERANQTLQDRLIKDMRLSNINSIEQAKAFLPRFMISYNEKFAVPPHDETPAHRPWTKPADDLDLALASQDERVLSKSLTFSYGGTKYCVKTQGPGTSMRGGKVMVHQFADGRLRFSYKERALTCTAYGTYPVARTARSITCSAHSIRKACLSLPSNNPPRLNSATTSCGASIPTLPPAEKSRVHRSTAS